MGLCALLLRVCGKGEKGKGKDRRKARSGRYKVVTGPAFAFLSTSYPSGAFPKVTVTVADFPSATEASPSTHSKPNAVPRARNIAAAASYATHPLAAVLIRKRGKTKQPKVRVSLPYHEPAVSEDEMGRKEH